MPELFPQLYANKVIVNCKSTEFAEFISVHREGKQ